MQTVNVLVTDTFGDECLEKIAAASPRIKLTDASPLFQAAGKIGVPIAEEKNSTAKKKLDGLLAEAEVIFTHRIPRDVFKRSPRLKWIQLTSVGVENFINAGILDSSVIVTKASGISAVNISEFVMGLMLAFSKQFPLYFRLKQEKQWKRFPPSVLRSKTVGIVGLGSIGQEVARLAKTFGMRVIATRRSTKRAGRTKHVDTMLTHRQLPRLLAESDFVVLTLPLTPETQQLIGEEELRTMKTTSYLINIARAGIVDEKALIRALDEQWIAGAGLDVFSTEPLPTNSRLWEFPNVILTPHVSGSMGDFNKQATELFLKNLRRYLDGKKLFNVVDKKKGY